MLHYSGRRFLQTIPVLFGITLISFFMLRLIPGDPAAQMLGTRAGTEENIARVRHQLGLDQPLIVQYLRFLEGIVRGDLGDSFFYKQPVLSLVAERVPVTIGLVLYASLISLVLTFPMALLAALKKDRPVDHAIRAIFLVTLGMPSFWVALMLMLVFSIRLGIFPISGKGHNLIENLRFLFLPAFTISVAMAPMLIRALRGSLIDVLQAPHVDFARAKGLPYRVVLIKHVLRNSLISTVTILGVNMGWLIGGTVVVETVFAVPGLGSLMINAIFARDYPMVQAITLVYALLVVGINFLTDISYSLLDPRVSLG
jgi:ABC-type dipeptide/oligopeptide/nickel transport system permease component